MQEERAAYGKEVVPGSKKAGVFWHTQGSGKSISMHCYAGKQLQQPAMNLPLVVMTDCNDLDGQLYSEGSAQADAGAGGEDVQRPPDRSAAEVSC